MTNGWNLLVSDEWARGQAFRLPGTCLGTRSGMGISAPWHTFWTRGQAFWSLGTKVGVSMILMIFLIFWVIFDDFLDFVCLDQYKFWFPVPKLGRIHCSNTISNFYYKVHLLIWIYWFLYAILIKNVHLTINKIHIFSINSLTYEY